MEDRLRGRDNDDRIRAHERRVYSEWNGAGRAELDQVLPLDVVHLDVTVEVAREFRRDECLQLLVARASGQSAGDEERLVAGGNAEPFQLGHRRGDRGLARVSLGTRQRQVRWFDHDRDARAAGDEGFERLAGERETQRIANGGADVRNRVRGRWRP